jgi:hypothetical protein
MFSFLGQTFQEWARSGTRTGARPCPVRRPECESLEDRLLLSLTPAQLFAKALPAADHAVVATAPGGRSVVAWEVTNSAINHDVKAQIFNASGKVGGVINVAGGFENQYHPTAAVNANGQFVVGWMTDFSLTDSDIRASLFNANGTAVRSNVIVASTARREYNPTAGIDARGNFDISYSLQYKGSDTDVLAAMFNASATRLRTVNVATTAAAEANTGIAVNPAGTFAVSYTSSGTPMIRHFAATGQPLDAGLRVTSTPPPPTHPTPPTPPPTHPTPPPRLPTLRGVVNGGYLPNSLGAGKGTRFDVVAIGYLAGMSETIVSGDVKSTGSARSSEATGVLTLTDSRGTVRLALTGPVQGPNAKLPSAFHYTVTSGTGAFTRLHSRGTVTLHLTPATDTLSIGIVP